MVDSVSVFIKSNEETKLKESLSFDDSVPTDLTVSVNAASQDHEISEISSIVDSEKVSQQQKKHRQDIVKRLRSELQLTKLSISKNSVETEKNLADKKQEIELLIQHAKIQNRENETLKRENNSLSQNIVDLQTKILRLLSENQTLEDAASKAKENFSGLERTLTELTVKHQRTLKYIERGEFTFDEFQRLKTNESSLSIKYENLGQENALLQKTVKKWKKKFTKLRDQYENRLQDEVAKLRLSLQKQIQILRSSSAETLNSKLLANEQRRDTAEKEANYWRILYEKLKSKVRELEVKEEKRRLHLEKMETKKNELVQRLSFVASTKSKLEKELNETKQRAQATIDNLKQDITEHERRAQQYQIRIENQTKSLDEYEEAFLAIYGADDESNRWPTLIKIQSQHTSRISKRVTQLETENSILKKQQNHLTNKINLLETELESKKNIISQVQGRAPETVGLFRDKDTLLRELRSQINRKDLQLFEYARQVDRLKRTRNQLASDLEEVLRDRTTLEDVKNILKQQENTEN